MLNGVVNWPRDIKHVPKGWEIQNRAKSLKIGIPGNPPFDKFQVCDGEK